MSGRMNSTLKIGRTGRKGFTLVELLVVIAIIAILAAILFPVFTRAKAKAKQTTCLANTKQISMAMLMYISDHDDTYPTVHGEYTGTEQWTSVIGWFHPLEPYVKERSIFNCPSIRARTNPGKMTWSGAPGMGTDYFVTYSIAAPLYTSAVRTAVCGLKWTGTMYDAPHSESEIVSPSRVITFNEIGMGWIQYHSAVLLVAGAECGQFSALHLSRPTHNRGLHFGFADGHVKIYNVDVIPDGQPTWLEKGISYSFFYDPDDPATWGPIQP